MAVERQSIKVSGMTCASCAATVSKAIAKSGVEDVYVDFTSGQAWFSNPQGVDTKMVGDRVAAAGYNVEKPNKRGNNVHKINIYFGLSLLLTIPLWLHMFSEASIFHNRYFQFYITIPIYCIGTFYFGKNGLRSTLSGAPNMDMLIWFSSSSAFFFSIYLLFFDPLSSVIFFETTGSIITFTLLGQVLEHYSVRKTNSSVDALLKKQPNQIRKKIEGAFHVVEASTIQKGDTIVVLEGETIGCDGVLSSGNMYVNESLLTGEGVLIEKKLGDVVYAGSVNEKGQAEVEVTKNAVENTISMIAALIHDAKSKKPSIQKIGDTVAAYFVPSVLAVSICTFLVLYYGFSFVFYQALMNSITVLVIACPCAVGLATPTAIAVGIGELTKHGLFVKNASSLEILSKTKFALFDKTGTLTDGKFEIKAIDYMGHDKHMIHSIMYSMESYSTHPIAVSLTTFLERYQPTKMTFEHIETVRGAGLNAVDEDGICYKIGRFTNEDLGDFSFFLYKDEAVIAKCVIEDRIKDGAKEMITYLKDRGITPVMVSGDKKSKCLDVAQKVGFDPAHVYFECTPKKKIEVIEAFSEKGITTMIGDGLNDAPALQVAHTGISFAKPNEVVSIESDIMVVKDNLFSIIYLFSFADKVLGAIKGNYFWAISYNIVAIPMASIGLFTPSMAAFIMAFSDVVVVGNSLLLKIKSKARRLMYPLSVSQQLG